MPFFFLTFALFSKKAKAFSRNRATSAGRIRSPFPICMDPSRSSTWCWSWPLIVGFPIPPQGGQGKAGRGCEPSPNPSNDPLNPHPETPRHEAFSKGRILKNSAFLYLRMLFTMWFNLWATRLVLANLGADQMGVYGVVGGIVTMFAVLTAGVTSAVQRFITFEQGRPGGDPGLVFCTSLNVIFVLAFIMLVLLEGVGLWMLGHAVNIPEASRGAAFWVFQFSVVAALVDVVSIPYNALVIAHERMGAFALVSVVKVLLGWGAAFLLGWVVAGNRLVVYAALMAAASIVVRIIYQVYCRLKFAEARYHLVFSRPLFVQMARFTGISTASEALQTLSGQGTILVINWTFGVALNAVYQIAMQLKNAVLSFGLNVFKAIAPQITKTYAEGNTTLHRKLVYSGSKLEFYMILLIFVPFMSKSDYIMQLWLGQVPPYAAAFARCAIFISLAYAWLEPVRTAVLATGRIGRFMIVPEVAYLLLVLPLAYAVGKVAGSPVAMMATIVAMDIVRCALRVGCARRVSFVRWKPFLLQVAAPCLSVLAVATLAACALAPAFADTLVGLALFLVVTTIVVALAVITIGVNREERRTVMLMGKRLLRIEHVE